MHCLFGFTRLQSFNCCRSFNLFYSWALVICLPHFFTLLQFSLLLITPLHSYFKTINLVLLCHLLSDRFLHHFQWRKWLLEIESTNQFRWHEPGIVTNVVRRTNNHSSHIVHRMGFLSVAHTRHNAIVNGMDFVRTIKTNSAEKRIETVYEERMSRFTVLVRERVVYWDVDVWFMCARNAYVCLVA